MVSGCGEKGGVGVLVDGIRGFWGKYRWGRRRGRRWRWGSWMCTGMCRCAGKVGVLVMGSVGRGGRWGCTPLEVHLLPTAAEVRVVRAASGRRRRKDGFMLAISMIETEVCVESRVVIPDGNALDKGQEFGESGSSYRRNITTLTHVSEVVE